MSFADAVRTVLGKYADFSGRARRSEYWYWTLAILLAYIVAEIIGLGVHALGTLLIAVIFLGSFVPSLAVLVRRLHDTDKSGLMALVGLIPFVGGLLLLFFAASDSTPGANRYGPSPKGIAGAAPGYGY